MQWGIARKQLLQQTDVGRVVFDIEDFFALLHSSSVGAYFWCLEALIKSWFHSRDKGRSIQNSVPTPSVLVKSSLPFIISTSCFVMTRPTPEPSSLLYSALSRLNGWNISRWRLAAIPGPLSRTAIRISLVSSSPRRSSTSPPMELYFTALLNRLINACLSRTLSATT